MKSARRMFRLEIFILHITMAIALYLLMPKLLNFPKYFDLISFQIETIKIPLIVYFVVIGIIIYVIETIIFAVLQRKVNKLIERDEERTNDYRKFVIEVREKCMNMPYKFMVIQLVIAGLLIAIVAVYFGVFGKLFIANFEKLKISIVRIIMILTATWLLLTVFEYFFLQKYSNTIIKESYVNNSYYKKTQNSTSNMISILVQIIPILITIFLILICFSYSNTIDVSSKTIATYYEIYFDNLDIDVDKDEIVKANLMQLLKEEVPLWEDDNVFFIIDYNGDVLTSTGEEISEFMLKYKDEYFYNYTDENGKDCINLNQDRNVIYESYGIDDHAFVKSIKDKYGRTYYIGVKYFAGNVESFEFLSLISVIIFAIYAVIFMYWAKSNSINMKKVEENMKEVLQDKDILKKNFIPILSNDEVGNISYYYNKIQDKLLTQRDIMFKQEQLSVLGELAGGMAHDINTPISSINTSILMLEKYANSDIEHEILDNMKISTERIINIVNSMRNQIRNLGSNDKEEFSLNNMIDDLHVLTQNEQKKNGCTFESDVKDEIQIYGEKTKLGQVLTNIVVNGIQAYGGQGKKGMVKLTAMKKSSNICRIEIEDQAGGIPKKVQKYLFKNIMTTKGAKGTGLGLYLAGSVIKGIYQGNIWFEVKEGVGTKFIIEIPMKMED